MCTHDDMLVASHSEEQHYTHLRALFDRLNKHGVPTNASNCELEKPSVNVLGNIVSSSGVAPLLDNVTAIQGYAYSHSCWQMWQFFGLINFYRRFVLECAKAINFLTDLLWDLSVTSHSWRPRSRCSFPLRRASPK